MLRKFKGYHPPQKQFAAGTHIPVCGNRTVLLLPARPNHTTAAAANYYYNDVMTYRYSLPSYDVRAALLRHYYYCIKGALALVVLVSFSGYVC